MKPGSAAIVSGKNFHELGHREKASAMVCIMLVGRPSDKAGVHEWPPSWLKLAPRGSGKQSVGVSGRYG